MFVYLSICIYIYIYTRNYALAIASASFRPGSHGRAIGQDGDGVQAEAGRLAVAQGLVDRGGNRAAG